MGYFAKIENGTVTQVIVADQSFVDSLQGDWLETNPDNSIRKNYAGIGYSYDAGRDAFISPKPFASWTLDEATCRWLPPTPYPNDGKYTWNETNQTWDAVE